MSGSAFLYSAPLLRTPEDYRKLSHSVDIVSVGVLMTVGAQCAQSTEKSVHLMFEEYFYFGQCGSKFYGLNL